MNGTMPWKKWVEASIYCTYSCDLSIHISWPTAMLPDINQLPLARDWWNCDTWDPITSARERTLSADNAHSQPMTPVWRTNFEMERFSSIYWWGNLETCWESSAIKHQRVDVFCFVLFRATAFAVVIKDDDEDHKDNKLLLASEICTNNCPWTLSLPRSSQLPSSFAVGQLFASRNR